MSAPMSSILLRDAADYYAYLGEGETGAISYAEKIALSQVYVAPITYAMRSQATGEEKDDRFILYFDCVGSIPVGQTFVRKSEVVYNGVSYVLRDIEKSRGDSSAVHHYALYLAGVSENI